MKKCQSCGYENTDASLFCAECGTKLQEKPVQKFCQHCGSEVEADALFCGECGKPLQSVEDKIVSQVIEEKPPVAPAPVVEKKAAAPEKKAAIPPVPNNTVVPQEEKPASEKKPTSIVPIIIVAVLCVIAIGVGIFFVTQTFGGGKENDKEIEQDDDNEDEDSEEVYETEEVEDTENSAEVDKTNPIPLTTSAEASSVYSEMEMNLIAMFDGNASTAWGEGVSGYGVGEWIKFTMQSETMVYGIAILPGNLASTSDFYSCGYPTEFEVTAGDIGQTVKISYYTPNFDFSGNPYIFLNFSEPVYTDEITITITGVKEGSGTNDTTCITELRLFTYPEVGSNVSVDANAWTVLSANAADYMLPTSNSAFLTMDDLAGFTAEDCRIARNELYARYGRRFSDETLQAYFDSKDWYIGTIEPEDFDDTILNEYEVHNRDLIVEYETQMGYR